MKTILKTGIRNPQLDPFSKHKDAPGSQNLTESFRRDKAFFDELQQMGHVGYWYLDLQTNCLTWSKEVYHICGVSAEGFKVTNDAFYGLVHPEDRDLVYNTYISSVRQGNDRFEIGHRIIRQGTGEIRHVIERCLHIRDGEGQIIASRGIVHDITDLWTARENLSEKNRMVNVLLDNLNGFAYRCLNDGDWTMQFMSGGVNEVTGYSVEEFLRMEPSYSSIILEEDRQRVWDAIQAAIGGNEPFTLEYRILDRNGNQKWVWERGKGVFVGGELQALEGYISDITEKKNADAENRRQHEQLNAIMAALPDLLFVMDPEGNFLELHGADLSQLVIPKEDCIGRNLSDLFPPELARLHKDKILEALQCDSLVTYEYHVEKEDCCVIREARVIPMSKAKVLVFIRDVTQKTMAEREIQNLNNNLEAIIRERTQELNSFFDVTLDMLCIADTNGYFLRLNRAWEQHLGYTLVELLSKPFLEFVYPDDIESTLRAMHTLEHEDNTYSFVNRFKTKQGGFRYIEWHSSLVGDRVYAAARDITERIEKEQELRNAKLEAEAANRTKSEFLANMSHEIRTPMNAIIGYSELLNTIVQNETEREYLNSIKASGKTLMTLINDILDLSKIEAGKLELVFEYIDTLDFFSEFERIFAFKIREKNLFYKLEIADSVPSTLCIDSVRLRQVILNLIGNSVKFTGKGGITLCVKAENFCKPEPDNPMSCCADLVIEVKDTGIGIPEEMNSLVFNSFYQVKGANKQGGTGLGLTITRDLVELMNGQINMQSVVDIGTTMCIRLLQVLCRSGRTLREADDSFNPEDIRFENGCLLVVDDMAEIRKFIRDVLKESRIRLYEADSGSAALKVLEKTRPDLILSDIRMPELDGYKLMNRILENKSLSKIPVIAFSASVMKEEKERILAHGFSGIITKPVKLTELFRILMQYLPYQRIVKPAVEGETSETGKIIDGALLFEKLNGPCRQEVHGFEMRQPMGQIRAFGERMRDLGQLHCCGPVIRFGNEMVHAAEDFNVDLILNMLNEYDTLVEELATRVNSG